jgi:hypothetical protein
MSTVEQVMNLLIEHTRINGIHGDCSCGVVVQLGRRFTEHQAQELHKAGLLRPDVDDSDGVYGVLDGRDAEFIAHARADVPTLVKALEAVLDAIDRADPPGAMKAGTPTVSVAVLRSALSPLEHPDTVTTEGTCPGGC